jgi:sec-independent protein translocase protein TatA
MNVLAFLDIGFAELVVVAFVALLLFGGRLPEVMRTLGQTYRNFRRGVEGLTRETTKVFDVRPPQTPYRPTAPPVHPAQGTAPWMPVTSPPPSTVPTVHGTRPSDAGPAAESTPLPMTTTPVASRGTAPASAPLSSAASKPQPSPYDDDPPPV